MLCDTLPLRTPPCTRAFMPSAVLNLLLGAVDLQHQCRENLSATRINDCGSNLVLPSPDNIGPDPVPDPARDLESSDKKATRDCCRPQQREPCLRRDLLLGPGLLLSGIGDWLLGRLRLL